MFTATQLIDAFDACFLSSYHTKLIGDADEPLYVPSKDVNTPAFLYFRFDYPSSALHEISHWCLAGKQRRQLEDYGYWYETDSRSLEQQKLFERVEVKPQAIECIFHWAANLSFRVSVDNLALPEYDAKPFQREVSRQVAEYIGSGLPERALTFAKYLHAQRLPDTDFNHFIKKQYENNSR
ncbi:elongation factor P hydroxylase [Marinomonas flavescens]|uniref:elongation factor P hydroxylase n=1 Tax=Marinomonas flavescens TaxID=2529379 RepID=UPI00105567CA|nr:elongation factor P hydroxylase [Marinomonas flavescens]